MNVVDSSGWLEYFADAKNADFFAETIADTDDLVVPTISLLEVFNQNFGYPGRSMLHLVRVHIIRVIFYESDLIHR